MIRFKMPNIISEKIERKSLVQWLIGRCTSFEVARKNRYEYKYTYSKLHTESAWEIFKAEENFILYLWVVHIIDFRFMENHLCVCT